MTACPCGLGPPLDACCGPLLDGAPAPTPERLMRSRYTAFALGDTAHLLASWHPDTRPARLRLDPAQRWTGLEVTATDGGGLLGTTGTVDFRAHWSAGRRTGVLSEHSRFVRFDGRWVYLDGDPVAP